MKKFRILKIDEGRFLENLETCIAIRNFANEKLGGLESGYFEEYLALLTVGGSKVDEYLKKQTKRILEDIKRTFWRILESEKIENKNRFINEAEIAFWQSEIIAIKKDLMKQKILLPLPSEIRELWKSKIEKTLELFESKRIKG